MYRDEQVSLFPIGNRGPCFQRQEAVSDPGIRNFRAQVLQ